MPRNSRFRRRPNNTGTVVKLSGKRRNPFCARVMSDERDIITGKKKQICIGTFSTREEALNALSIYSLKRSSSITNEEARNLAPDLFEKIQEKTQKRVPTFKEIFTIIDNETFSKRTEKGHKNILNAFSHLDRLSNMPVNIITLRDMQNIFDEMCSGVSVQRDMKYICVKVFEYAVMHKYISRDDDYSTYIKIKNLPKSTMHKAFTLDEIKKLKKLDTPEAHIMLIYIYTGCRLSELLSLDRKQIHIDEPCNDDGVERRISYIITGSKTEAGRNRIIPIHEGIKQYVIDELINKKERLFVSKRTWFYMTVLYALNDQLGMNHKMHDTRDTFASLCQLYNVDIYIRKKVLGHKLNDITFDIYTNASKNKLWTEINKIKF